MTEKTVCTRLGRNSVCCGLMSKNVSELQIATLQGWDIDSVMQSTYASNDPISVMPAMITSAGFDSREAYAVPRAGIDPESACPNVWKLLFDEGVLVAATSQYTALCDALAARPPPRKKARNSEKTERDMLEGAVHYLKAEKELMKALLQNLPFYAVEYGPAFILYRLGVFQQIAAQESLVAELKAFAQQVVVAHYAKEPLERVMLQHMTLEGLEVDSYPPACDKAAGFAGTVLWRAMLEGSRDGLEEVLSQQQAPMHSFLGQQPAVMSSFHQQQGAAPTDHDLQDTITGLSAASDADMLLDAQQRQVAAPRPDATVPGLSAGLQGPHPAQLAPAALSPDTTALWQQQQWGPSTTTDADVPASDPATAEYSFECGANIYSSDPRESSSGASCIAAACPSI